ncbi:hypothetical protein BDZ91DRAFT_796577 [Kalaharituber pfeilii]|nr:hypothetical protein BDZ91DRAFT_796577 [Kalaharituber pfeilii]
MLAAGSSTTTTAGTTGGEGGQHVVSTAHQGQVGVQAGVGPQGQSAAAAAAAAQRPRPPKKQGVIGGVSVGGNGGGTTGHHGASAGGTGVGGGQGLGTMGVKGDLGGMGGKVKGVTGPGGVSGAGAAGAAGGAAGQGGMPVSIYGALVEGTGIPSAEEVLCDTNLTWQFWTNMHDHYKHHFSAELPFLHAPTFLSTNRLQLPSQHILSKSTSSSDDKTSYPLCLGILTLMGRFYPPLMKLHQAYAQSVAPPPSTAPGGKPGKSSHGGAAAAAAAAAAASSASTASEGRRIGEFYSAVLRKHLFGPTIPTGRDVAISQPTMEKVQALLMLAVHEWIGEGRAERAQLWVGLAARMASMLGLGRTGGSAPTTAAASTAASAAAEDDDDVNGGSGSAMELDDPASASRKRRKLSSSGASGTGTTGSEAKEKEKKELVIQEEIARRTFWSIFMLDRALTKGSRRELAIRLEDINGLKMRRPTVVQDEFEYPEEEEEDGGAAAGVVRLPCNDQSFLFGQKVGTGVLRIGSGGGDVGYFGGDDGGGGGGGGSGDSGAEGDTGVVWQVGEKEGELSRIIRGMEIWGRVRRWRGPPSYQLQHQQSSVTQTIVNGEPTVTPYPPTPPPSFTQLRDLINTYSAPLPLNLTFSPDNLNAHIHSKSSTSYAIIHVINFLSRMVLHRVNMPFLPPNGGSTHSTRAPPHVLDSAKEVFRAARGVLDLVKGLTDWNVGVETPLVGYAVYVAGVWSVYAAAFPGMDEEKLLAAVGGGDIDENPHVQTAASQLRRFMARWCLGGGDGRRWSDGLMRLAGFYTRVSAAMGWHVGSHYSQYRHKVNGGYGLERPTQEEYVRFERMFWGLGRDELAGWVETPPPPPPAQQQHHGHGHSHSYSHGSLNVPSGSSGFGQRRAGSTPAESKKRVSPQPPQVQHHHHSHQLHQQPTQSGPTDSQSQPPRSSPSIDTKPAISSSSTTTPGATTTTASGSTVPDRWHAINKSPPASTAAASSTSTSGNPMPQIKQEPQTIITCSPPHPPMSPAGKKRGAAEMSDIPMMDVGESALGLGEKLHHHQQQAQQGQGGWLSGGQ